MGWFEAVQSNDPRVTVAMERFTQRRLLAAVTSTIRDALELTPATSNRMASFYRPLRFVPSEKLTGADKLLLAFDALVISHIISRAHQTGKLFMAANTEQR
jgi:hypothetical protein